MRMERSASQRTAGIVCFFAYAAPAAAAMMRCIYAVMGLLSVHLRLKLCHSLDNGLGDLPPMGWNRCPLSPLPRRTASPKRLLLPRCRRRRRCCRCCSFFLGRLPSHVVACCASHVLSHAAN
jgi:hypothetical protein